MAMATSTSTSTSIAGGGGPDPEVISAVEQRGNVVVFFDMVLGGEPSKSAGGSASSAGAGTSQTAGADLGRIKLELFVKDVSLKYNFVMYNLLC
jgi:hypothetical protein